MHPAARSVCDSWATCFYRGVLSCGVFSAWHFIRLRFSPRGVLFGGVYFSWRFITYKAKFHWDQFLV